MSLTLVNKLGLTGQVFGSEEEIDAGLVQILGGDDGLGEEIPAETDELEIPINIGAAALKAFLIGCTGADLVVKTNNASTPDHTFNLTAGAFGGWSASGPFANPLGSTDVTAIYVSNASTTTPARLVLVTGVDPTP